MNHHATPWTDEDQSTLVVMAGDGATATEIGAVLGKTRNAVLGRAHRQGIKLPLTEEKVARSRPKRERKPRVPRAPGTQREPNYRKLRADHPARLSRPRGARAFPDARIAVAIAARLAGQSYTKAARMIGAEQQILHRWMAVPELLAAGTTLFEQAKSDAAERAAIKREVEAFEAETKRLTVERINWPILGRMNERHREICEMRIAGKTLQEVGDKFGVTRERIRQIEVTWKIRGLIVPGTRPVSEASRATFTHKERGERRPKVPRPPRVRRPMQLSDAERARRAEHMRRVSNLRWAEARA